MTNEFPPPPKPDYALPHPKRTLGYFLADWLAHHAVVPEGDLAGSMFEPTIDHKVFLANHYRVRPDAQRGERAAAFVYRRSAWIAAQKVGKSPGIAGHALIEFVGPSLFDGFAFGGETYRCADHRCSCGWEYEFGPGEPMGRPWATPRIQLAAVVEEARAGQRAQRPDLEGLALGELRRALADDDAHLAGVAHGPRPG